jgi:threonine dehydrogenase-like Zn-dependent dehydrogenase
VHDHADAAGVGGRHGHFLHVKDVARLAVVVEAHGAHSASREIVFSHRGLLVSDVLTLGARELLEQLTPAKAMRRWMDLFADWLATKHGMLDTLLAMIESGEIALAHTRTELLDAITMILDAGRAAGDLRADISAEDVGASLIGIFTVAGKPGQHPQANRLLDLLMDGLTPRV